MKQLYQNKQTLYYANYSGDIPIYAYDEDGNVIKTDVDGELVDVIESYASGYEKPVLFKANISVNSGDTRQAEYGLNVDEYNAIISADKGKLPFTEQTLIWHKSVPIYDSSTGLVKPESADYRVIAIKTSLNEERFILKKQAENRGSNVPSA